MDKPDNHTDLFILKLLALNDERAISILYQQHASTLFKTSNLILDNEDAAHELVQELFITIWEKRGRLNIKPPIKSYLLRAVTNKSRNYLRNRKTKGQLITLDQRTLENMVVQPGVESNLDAEDLRKLIQTTKRLLPPKTRIVFILSRSLQMSYKEIAEYLGVSQKSVEKHISKALKYFRKMKSDYLRILFLSIIVMYEMIEVCGFIEVGLPIKIVC